jgi:hypothetical protein
LVFLDSSNFFVAISTRNFHQQFSLAIAFCVF